MCEWCKLRPATARCDRCKSTWYCSVDCQRASWRARHRQECAIIVAELDKQSKMRQWQRDMEQRRAELKREMERQRQEFEALPPEQQEAVRLVWRQQAEELGPTRSIMDERMRMFG